MGGLKPEIMKKHICMGLLAHVDAGKTTLAESLLYFTGSIRKLGRVDHKDTFLDTHEIERERGITVFSKQARLTLGDWQVTLLDTPGHEDFSAEMERTLQVLDYAILIISGADGVRGHDETLWKLLKTYEIPTFIFVNKMDQQGTDQGMLMARLKEKLGDECVDFSEKNESFAEAVAMCDEAVLEEYLESGIVKDEDIIRLISERKLFPCYFGSALKHERIDRLIEGLKDYMTCKKYPEQFGARVYKISRDDKGVRLTHLKVTGGVLKVKMPLETGADTSEKADQIRLYSGTGFEMAGEVTAGCICAVTGPVNTRAGQGLGIEKESRAPLLTPVLTYEIRFPDDVNIHEMLGNLRALEEEIPELHIIWNSESREIHAQVMGEVQIEILKTVIAQRFGVLAEFDSGSIIYRETIENAVEGVGHFEPLRHYAEVHLLMEPLPYGSGIVIDSVCSEDALDRNWQRLILTHLAEKSHRGVLTGSEITDMKLTLMAGRAHLKHTEGGDFRQASYRAVRQGLKSAKSILLEPFYNFTLTVPQSNVGRALNDIQKMCGSFEPPMTQGEFVVITGKAPVALMQGYMAEVSIYTKGQGHLFCEVSGYEPCHNAEEVIESAGYDSEADLDNPTGSVFCAHGAGFNVPWNEVPNYMHLPSCMKKQKEEVKKAAAFPKEVVPAGWADEEELEAIFERTYGPIKRDRNRFSQSSSGSFSYKSGNNKAQSHNDKVWDKSPENAVKKERKQYLLVDGYNIIFAWDDLNELSKINMESARTKLADMLCDYQGFCHNTLILVFDAYRVEGHPGSISQYRNIYIVYTKEAETADQYIEKTVHEIGKRNDVTVATSDGTEQVIILGQGAKRLSARGLLEEMMEARRQMRKDYLEKNSKGGQLLLENISEDMAQLMEDVRLGYRSLGGEDKK